MKRRTLLMIVLVFGIGLLIGSVSGFAQNAQSQNDQGSLAATTAQWWQAMLSIPESVNPISDSTGAHCMIGQRDPLWFLAGGFIFAPPQAISRDCTIPAGEAVLFPVINNVVMNTPHICGQHASQTVAQLRAQVASMIDQVTAKSATLDGQPLQVIRVQSTPFAATLPADNIYNQPCITYTGGPQPAGVFSPSVDDGYYSFLPPLTVGSHTLKIYAEVSNSPAVDVTYHLKVVLSSSK